MSRGPFLNPGGCFLDGDKQKPLVLPILLAIPPFRFPRSMQCSNRSNAADEISFIRARSVTNMFFGRMYTMHSPSARHSSTPTISETNTTLDTLHIGYHAAGLTAHISHRQHHIVANTATACPESENCFGRGDLRYCVVAAERTFPVS